MQLVLDRDLWIQSKNRVYCKKKTANYWTLLPSFVQLANIQVFSMFKRINTLVAVFSFWIKLRSGWLIWLLWKLGLNYTMRGTIAIAICIICRCKLQIKLSLDSLELYIDVILPIQCIIVVPMFEPGTTKRKTKLSTTTASITLLYIMSQFTSHTIIEVKQEKKKLHFLLN